jgi:hypothetical protein
MSIVFVTLKYRQFLLFRYSTCITHFLFGKFHITLDSLNAFSTCSDNNTATRAKGNNAVSIKLEKMIQSVVAAVSAQLLKPPKKQQVILIDNNDITDKNCTYNGDDTTLNQTSTGISFYEMVGPYIFATPYSVIVDPKMMHCTNQTQRAILLFILKPHYHVD